MSVNMEITDYRWYSVLRAYNSHNRYVFCSSPTHVVPQVIVQVPVEIGPDTEAWLLRIQWSTDI